MNEEEYEVKKLTDKEIEKKLFHVNSDLDFHQAKVEDLSEEQDYLYEEKNKRYAKSKEETKRD